MAYFLRKPITLAGRVCTGESTRILVWVLLILAIGNTSFALSGCSGRAQGEPLPGYATIYVSVYGSDSNDGLGWGTAKATLAGALRALPLCSAADVKGKQYTLRCGQIEIAAGTLNVTSAVSITSPLVSIIGTGSASSRLLWSGAGCAITTDMASTNGIAVPGPTFEGFSIDGSSDTNPNSCGLSYTEGSHVTIRDLVISNFTAGSDSCLYGATSGLGSEERAVFEHVYLGNCTVGWLLRNVEPSWDTIGYGNFDLYINVEAGQTGILSEGNGKGAELRLFFSVFHLIVNIDDPSGTCAVFSNYSFWSDDTGVFRCDGPSRGIRIDGTSHLYFGGDLDSDGGQSVANGGDMVVHEIAQDPITGNDGLVEWSAATATNPGTGPHWDMQGQYWNGVASAADIWDFQQVPSENGSTLVLQHTVGPNNGDFATPTLQILASPNGYGGFSNTLAAAGGGYYHNALPATNGALISQGSDGVSAGTIAMLGGSGSHSFGTPYTSTPVCTATDTTSAAPVMITSSTTAVSVRGAGTDVVAWICVPPAN